MAQLPSRRSFFGGERGLRSLRNEIEDLFEGFMGSAPTRVEERRWMPALDIKENDAEYLLKAELPGMDASNVEISYQNGVLRLKGEKEEERKEEGEEFRRTERRHGMFTRSIRLPVDIRDEKIDASMSNGVLTIRCPKAEAAKKKHIKVKVK